MDPVTLTALRRERTGRGGANAARRRGHIPAVVYGHIAQASPIEVDAREFDRILRDEGMTALIMLSLEGEETAAALVKEIQRQPVSKTILHVDFLAVALDVALQIAVPVECVGHAAGERQGGVVEHLLREVIVRCMPNAIPSSLSLDIAALEQGHHLSAADIELPPGVELVTDPGETVVAVVGASPVELPEEGEAEAEAEGEAAEEAEA